MSKQSSLTRLHDRLSTFMLVTLVLAGGLAGLFLVKSAEFGNSRNDLALTNRLSERRQHIDSQLARIADHVLALRTMAESRLKRPTQKLSSASRHHLKSSLQHDKRQGYFHLDTLHHPTIRKNVGSLTGLGDPSQVDAETLQEMQVVLDLNVGFQAGYESFPAANRFYYISERNFLSYYPWRPANRLHFTPALLENSVFLGGTPALNPQRRVYWPDSPFADDAGAGTGVCAAPVYGEGKFVGIVAMDFDLHGMRALSGSVENSLGSLLLIDEQDRIVPPPPTAKRGSAPPPILRDMLPPELKPLVGKIVRLPAAKMTELGNHDVLRLPLKNAPWNLVFFRLHPTLFQSLVDHYGAGSLFIILGLILLIATWMLITLFYVIRPSRLFLEFLLARSRRQPVAGIRPPACWLPWFNTVDTIFRDNENLNEKIACQNQLLEKRVAKRTRDLGRSNAALRKANRKLKALSLMDELTQLANYRHFEGFLQQIWGMMQRRKEPVSLLLCDVDYFKQYNDTYGHQAGNHCLKAIAGVLSDITLRSCDLAARYGGEEFIVLLPGLSMEKAEHFARRIQERIAELAIPHVASKAASIVTVSIGIATLTPSHHCAPSQLFEQADQALYRAKSRGRNCIA
jgi:diguanylate cyclase (GGDEF)-like protein